MVEIAVVAADIMQRPCDLILLKHADGFYGVDSLISDRIGFRSGVQDGESVFVRGRGIEAYEVLYLGVGALNEFRYREIRQFGNRILSLAAQRNGVRTVCTPLHGPGYGLDEREAFLSLVGGFFDAIVSGSYPADLDRIEIVELSSSRAQRLTQILSETMERPIRAGHPFKVGVEARSAFSTFGNESERKTKLFVAMPFAPEHTDVWEIAIQESCQAAGLICERVDQNAYTGEVLGEIRRRVAGSSGVIAVLDDANPNVFLEIGFAWGLEKPTVLVSKEGATLPFDVRGQKCIQYTSIANLRKTLTEELGKLARQGVFGARQ
jgi:hypothetical protein